MDLAIRWHRLLRALAFLAGGLVFSVAIIFIFSNLTPIEVHWRIPATVGYTYDLTLKGVNTWLLAILPLLVGAVIGYLYQTPARMHHVREALRHRHRVHELEHELKEVRKNLDQVLLMPEDGSLAVQASLLPQLEHRDPHADAGGDLDPRLPEEPAAVALLGAGHTAEPGPKVIRAARARKAPASAGLLGALKAEIAGIHLPGSIPATVVVKPRRNGKSPDAKPAGVKPTAAAAAAAKPAGAKPTRLKPGAARAVAARAKPVRPARPAPAARSIAKKATRKPS